MVGVKTTGGLKCGEESLLGHLGFGNEFSLVLLIRDSGEVKHLGQLRDTLKLWKNMFLNQGD